MDRHTGEMIEASKSHMVLVHRLPRPAHFGEFISGAFAPIDDREFPEPADWARRTSGGSGGAWSMENCRWGCHECHLGEMHQKGTKFEGGEIGRA